MKKLIALAALLAAVFGARGAAEEALDLISATAQKPLVFASKAGEFTGKELSRALGFAVDGAALFGDKTPLGRDGALRVRIRATDPFTDSVELIFRQSDRKVWGTTRLPITEDWCEVLLPFAEMSYFSHWGGMPPVKADELPNEKRLTQIAFNYGTWLCRTSTDKPHGFEVSSVQLVRLAPGALGDGRNHSLDEFPRLPGEQDDTRRFQRAVFATARAVLSVPRGTYLISSPIQISNFCSLDLDKSATLRAVAPMSCLVRAIGNWGKRGDYNVFIRGGVFDGAGLASCVNVKEFVHFTMRDTSLFNGRVFGLRVDGGCEFMGQNIYAKCLKSGLAGNAAFLVNGGDSHYTDCVVVDYTIGFDERPDTAGANRYTRCHVWGGPVPPRRPGELPEMLKDSICFKLCGGDALLRDCYADTGAIGYYVGGWNTRLLGCSYFNNKHFKLDGITIVKHVKGFLLVSDSHFRKTTPNCTVYDGIGTVKWSNMLYSGFDPKDNCPGR